MSRNKLAPITVDALAALAAENAGRSVDKHRAKRLVAAGMAQYTHNGRCALTEAARVGAIAVKAAIYATATT